MKLLRAQVARVLDSLGLDPDVYIRSDYSGRFMYGERCFGIVGDIREYSQFLLQLTEEDAEYGSEHAYELAERVCTDNMGLHTLFYFPGVALSDEGEETE